jgi:hypothetical protein
MIRRLMALCVAMMPVAAQADWYEADSKHFAVFSNDEPKHLQAFAEQLERFDKAMRVFRGVDDPPVPPVGRVTVFVVKDIAEIQSLAGPNVAGFYRPSVSGPVAFVPKSAPSKNHISGSRLFTGTSGGAYDLDSDSVLRHEYTHHFMFDNYPTMALPFWFVEGFAEFHGTAMFGADGSVTFGAPPAYRASSLIDRNQLSVRDMLTSDSRKVYVDEVSEIYGRGWLLIHYLTFEPSRRGQLGAFLQALNQGKTPIEAARVFGDLDQLQRELTKQINAAKIDVRTVPASAITIDPVSVRKLSAGEAVSMPARIRSKAGVDKTAAPGVLAMARKAAEQTPDDAAAQLELAEAAIDAKENATALAAADRAIALSPTMEKAFVFKGRAEQAIAKAAGHTDAATWSAVRHSFAQANRLQNDDPEPLMLYYRSYAAAGQAPSANSKAGLYHALELLADDPRLRLDVVFQRIADGDYAQANAALAPIAYAPSHGAKFTTFAADLSNALGSGDKARIAAAMTALKAERDRNEQDS